MKKILGSLVVAVALWAGTTAFIGTQIEKNLQQQINHTNNLYTEYGIQYKLNNYKKSFFTSKAEVEIKITDPMMLELLKESVKLPIILDYEVEHGPIFLKNGLSLGAVQIHKELALSSLLKDEAKKEFLTLLKDDIKITNDISISFNKNASYNIVSDAIKVDKDGQSFTMSPLSIKGNSNIETFKGDTHLNIPSLTFTENKTQNGIKIENLLMNINIEEFIENALMLGTIDVTADKLMIKDDENPPLSQVDIALKLQMKNEKDTPTSINSIMEGDIDFKDTKLPASFPQLKNLHAKVDVKSLGIKGMIEFQQASKEMQEAQKELFSNMGNKSSSKDFEAKFTAFQKIQEKMVDKIIHALNSLLIKDKSTISYAINIQTKDNKESKVSTDVHYIGDIEFKGKMEEVAMKVQEQALDLVNLNVNLTLNKEHVKSFPDAEKLNQQIQMGVKQGFVKETNENYLLNGYYKNRELIVNDNNLTSIILPFLMMATQAGH